MEVKLGQKVKDTVTGLEGLAVARTTYIYGCARISIQPFSHKDGKPAEWVSFDEPQLKVIGEDASKVALGERPESKKTGGPQPQVTRGR